MRLEHPCTDHKAYDACIVCFVIRPSCLLPAFLTPCRTMLTPLATGCTPESTHLRRLCFHYRYQHIPTRPHRTAETFSPCWGVKGQLIEILVLRGRPFRTN